MVLHSTDIFAVGSLAERLDPLTVHSPDPRAGSLPVTVDLVTVAEIADMLGVSRTQVHRLAGREDFPRPVTVLAVGRIWRRRDIERWAATKRRSPGGQEKPYPPR